MHKININLHNLKTALIFSIEINNLFEARFQGFIFTGKSPLGLQPVSLLPILSDSTTKIL